MEVVTIRLPPGNQHSDDHLVEVAMAYEETAQQSVKAFHTYVDQGDEHFVFLTTSKDIHLGFGAVSKKGQYHLAKLLEQSLIKGDCTELLIQRDAESKGAILVTAPPLKDGVATFHCSPAH